MMLSFTEEGEGLVCLSEQACTPFTSLLHWPTFFLLWGWMRRRERGERRESQIRQKGRRAREREREREMRKRTRGHVKREERREREREEEGILWEEREGVKERASVGGLGFAQRPWLLSSSSSSSSSSSLLHTFTLPALSPSPRKPHLLPCSHLYSSIHPLFSLPFSSSLSLQMFFSLFSWNFKSVKTCLPIITMLNLRVCIKFASCSIHNPAIHAWFYACKVQLI